MVSDADAIRARGRVPLPVSAEPLTAHGARVLLAACWAGADPGPDRRRLLEQAVALLQLTLRRGAIVPSWTIADVWAGVDATDRERAWRRLAGTLAGVVVFPDPDLVVGAGDLAAVSAIRARERPALVLLDVPRRPVLAPWGRFGIERLPEQRPWAWARLVARRWAPPG